MQTLEDWLQLDDRAIAELACPRAATAVVYLNGTRRWFLSQSHNQVRDWSEYASTTGLAQRKLCDLFYAHGIRALVQPLMGYGLLRRGRDYMRMAVERGLAELTTPAYRDWFRLQEICLTLYGNWQSALEEMGFARVGEQLREVEDATRLHAQHRLLLGVFGDEGLDRIAAMARGASRGTDLLHQYYGQPIGPIDVVLGSGQPALWDVPLLDVNRANLYFLQAPTLCLDRVTLRRILYDHLYLRTDDDEPDQDLDAREWGDPRVLGLGRRTRRGWIAG